MPAVVSHSRPLYRASIFEWADALARRLPLAFTRALAALGGTVYAWTHPRRVALVHRNLRLLDDTLPRRAARRVYAEFGKTLADYFYIGTRSVDDAVKIIARIEGREHLLEAHRQGKGALIITAHFGLFELGGLLLAQHGFPSVVLTLPEPSGELSAWRAAFRRRFKVETLEIGSERFAFVEIAQRLRQGHFVATLIDRPHPTDAVPVAFPHGTAYYSSAILLLAAHIGVPVIPATMARQDDGLYLAQVSPPLQIKNLGSRAETLRHYSARITEIFLPMLTRYPAQWYQFVPLQAPPAAARP